MRALIIQSLLSVAWTIAWPHAAAACSIETQAVVFGNVDVTRASEATGKITLECPNTAVFLLSIGSSNDGADRIMAGPQGSVLRYRLYSDANFIQLWGDGGATGSAISGIAGAGSVLEYDIYGRIPEQNLVLPGEYTDLPVVTLTY